jgi:polyisoprenoid-binding protein YceI
MISRYLAGAIAVGLALTPGLAAAAKWEVRAKESSIALVVTFEGVPLDAKFGAWDADIDFDPADLAHSTVTVGIGTGSFDSQSEERDEAVKEPDWFDVAAYPQARFVTKSIRPAGAGRYEAIADLTVRNITREVKLPFSLTIEGTVARMDGTLTVQRAEFGVGQGQWAATDHVGGSVVIKVHVVADQVR